MQLYIIVKPSVVLVMPPPINTDKVQADAPPIPIHPGGNYLGISYSELRASGNGAHNFKDPQ